VPEGGRIEPGRAEGVRGFPGEGAPPLPKEWPPDKIGVPTLKAGADRSPVAEWVAWEARGQRERVGCEAHEAKGSEGSTGQ